MNNTVPLSLEDYDRLKQQASRRREDIDRAVKEHIKFAVSEKTAELWKDKFELQREIHKLQAENIELRAIQERCTYAENQLKLMRRRGLFARIFNRPVDQPKAR